MLNQQLAHELLLDPLFQLEEEGGPHTENRVFHNIRESFHSHFWDSLEDDLKLEYPCYVRAIRVLEQICDGIHDLCESSGICEVVDLEFVSQQAQACLYTWQSTQKLLAGIVCERETKTKWEALQAVDIKKGDYEAPCALCNQLEFLLNRINVMSIDASNARLRLISSVIIHHGMDYERNNLFNVLCTLVNTLHGRRARAQQRYADDYLRGFDVDAFSVVGFDGKRTVLMHCICANMPFCVRWHILNSNANVHVKNRANTNNAIFFSMQAYVRLEIAYCTKLSRIRV